MANTWGYDVFRSPASSSGSIRSCSTRATSRLARGHPQGGNALGADPRRPEWSAPTKSVIGLVDVKSAPKAFFTAYDWVQRLCGRAVVAAAAHR